MTSDLPQIPLATYRLQLSGHLTFETARDLVGYLSDLGIGAAYLSPLFRARLGSTHGYDVIDPGMLEPELGTEQEFGQFAEALRASQMGIVLDIVPNHMGIDDQHNAWWQDVLENGPCSPYARFFDIDWNPPKEVLRGKVLLPTLGDQFGKILEDQQLQLEYDDHRFVIRYYERRFPTDPRTWVPVLRQALEMVAQRLLPEVPERMELESIITSLEHLPPRNETNPERIGERYREKEVARRRLAALLETSGEVRQAIEQTIVDYNGRKGEPASFDKLEELITSQAYRLCYWRVATDEINYRRFFDIDALAAIRVEDPAVFEALHERVLHFVAQGWVTGLRIDHADGLLDPRQYLTNLAEAVRGVYAQQDQTPPPAETGPPIYTVVEKILAHDESLPPDWPIHGTTGYDLLNIINGLFVERRGTYRLRDLYARFTGQTDNFAQVLYESKRTILSASLSAELYTLSHQLDRLSEQHRWSRDFTRLSLFRALREVVACFPVYRTYIRSGCAEVREEDRRRILSAVRIAKRRNPAMSPTFFDFIAAVMLQENPDGLSEEAREERCQFVLKFQQVTGPVTAKGLEDTAFYRYYPLASLNEVGGEPTIPGTSVDGFHRRAAQQLANSPHGMVTTGTHDTKRGEDVRARLNVLSETPEEWEAAIRRWQEMNAEARSELDGARAPDANEEYLIYQTIVGTWPLQPLDPQGAEQYIERIVRYLEKALKEAKLHTSWLNPYEEYDQAVANFIRTTLAGMTTPFAADVDRFVRSIADAGFVNSLAQTLVKICMPGLPDFYQGTELWDFNLVDPDNRRPVNFDARRAALDELRRAANEDLAATAAGLLERWPDERVKLFTIWRALNFRREHPELFRGDYRPLEVAGPHRDHVAAFARVSGTEWTICIVPRLVLTAWRDRGANHDQQHGPDWPLASWWRETTVQLPPEAPRQWRHVLSGQTLATSANNEAGPVLDAGDVLHTFPVALLSGGAD